MSRIDPWEKAADCERAIQAAADPQQKTILKNLRYLWIALANESDCMSADEFAHDIDETNPEDAVREPLPRPVAGLVDTSDEEDERRRERTSY